MAAILSRPQCVNKMHFNNPHHSCPTPTTATVWVIIGFNQTFVTLEVELQ